MTSELGQLIFGEKNDQQKKIEMLVRKQVKLQTYIKNHSQAVALK